MPEAANIIDIHDLSHDGRGIGRIADGQGRRGKTCFVAGALPGETVSWKSLSSKRSFEEGVLIEVLKPSPDRVAPRCKHIEECGGCELQHLESKAQLRAKEQQLRQAFAREHLNPSGWLAPLSGNSWAYRRRTRLAVSYLGKDSVLGYRRRGSKELVAIQSCTVLEPRIDALLPPLSALITSLRNCGLSQIELTLGDTDPLDTALPSIAICLMVKKDPALAGASGEKALQSWLNFCLEHSAQLWIREGRGQPQPIKDCQPLSTTLTNTLDMQFTPSQFVQSNAEINRKMIAQAMTLLDLRSESRVLDLFCGAGNFSLPIASLVERMLGIEGLPDLIMQADANAQRQGLQSAEFRVADLAKESALSGPSFAQGSFDRVLLDPPRTGAKNLMPALNRLAAPKIVYVSCHPATLVRDAKILAEGGYHLSKAGVIDMFPQTTHLEAMALFELT